MCGVADSAGRLYFLALIVEAECDNRLGSILVGNGLGGRELGVGLLDIVVVGPVLTVMVGLEICLDASLPVDVARWSLTWT